MLLENRRQIRVGDIVGTSAVAKDADFHDDFVAEYNALTMVLQYVQPVARADPRRWRRPLQLGRALYDDALDVLARGQRLRLALLSEDSECPTPETRKVLRRQRALPVGLVIEPLGESHHRPRRWRP